MIPSCKIEVYKRVQCVTVRIEVIIFLVFLEVKYQIIFTIDPPQIINLASQFNNPHS